MLRENVAAGRQTKLTLVRDMVLVADVTAGGIVPVKIQDIVEPLQEGLIYNKVGLPFNTGLAGDFVWPVYEAVEATFAGEGVALSDTTIDMSKVNPKPERIGLAIPVSREAINQSEGVIENIVKNVMPQALYTLINKVLFSTTKVSGASAVAGPFVAAAASATTLSATPTFAELNAMKAAVLKNGVKGENLCWVMSKAMEATLEGEPINSNGVYKPIAENHMMCGLPIQTTQDIVDGTTEYIGLGDWRYQPAGLFGGISFVVDPYSQARKNAVDFVLNADFATATLQAKAFVLGKVGA